MPVSDHGSQVNGTLVPVDPTETGAGGCTKTFADCEEQSGHVGEKRQYPWHDEMADEPLINEKREKMDEDQGKQDEFVDEGAQIDVVVSGDEEANVEEEDEEEDEEEEEDGDEEADDYDDDLTEDEDCDDGLSSDTNGSDEHRCQVCSLTFSTTFLLHEHLHVHNGVRLYQCAECGKRFCHQTNYRKHLRSHSQASANQCIICTSKFPNQEELQNHLDTNHFEDKFFQCDLCKRIFTGMAECKKHVQTHKRPAKRYPCPKCERSFRHRSSMLYHLKRHKKGVFVCTDCGLAFSTKAVLLRHSFHHLGLLPYTCIRCKRHFRLSSQYMKHECKPEQSQCVACLGIFKSKEDFLKHKKDTGCWGHQTALNTKTNDIRCMECGQVFNSSEELKKHAGTHQRVMRCSECGMGFRSSIMLMSHMGGHAANRPCLCQECGQGFCHQQAYDSHLKTCGLVNPAEIATKKQKKEANPKKEAVTIPKTKEIRSVPQLVPMHPTTVLNGQTKPPEALTTITLNNEPLTPVPLVMLLPVSSTSKPKSIPNSDVSKKRVSAPQLIHIPLASNNRSVSKESDKTVLIKDLASPVPGSNILIPLTSLKSGKAEWTVVEGPCTSGSVTTIYTIKKETEQVLDTNAKQPDAKNELKKNVLSNLEILQILNMLKKNGGGDARKENTSSLISVVSVNSQMKAGDEKQSGSRMENGDPSLIKSSDAWFKTNTVTDRPTAAKLQPESSYSDSSAVMGDSLAVQKQPEKDQMPKSAIPSPPKFSEEKDFGVERAGTRLGDDSDVMQCEVCGEMISEKDLDQHKGKHSACS
ncbi:zinc finger protein 628 [Silurus asotus]|uniref:Zinc finger protein 628 n=1 Tax=Silurus asotus TaxID=30991 RepID=A0AAD5FLX7_SILAS|nr:zinc finger protein 628 [Silurus asotus]